MEGSIKIKLDNLLKKNIHSLHFIPQCYDSPLISQYYISKSTILIPQQSSCRLYRVYKIGRTSFSGFTLKCSHLNTFMGLAMIVNLIFIYQYDICCDVSRGNFINIRLIVFVSSYVAVYLRYGHNSLSCNLRLKFLQRLLGCFCLSTNILPFLRTWWRTTEKRYLRRNPSRGRDMIGIEHLAENQACDMCGLCNFKSHLSVHIAANLSMLESPLLHNPCWNGFGNGGERDRLLGQTEIDSNCPLLWTSVGLSQL